MIVYLYVDDLIFIGNNPSILEEFKKDMLNEFEMIDMGLMAYYLRIEVKQTDNAKEVPKKFKVDEIKLRKHENEEILVPTLYKSLIESLRNLTCTRSDILYAVGVVGHYMEALTISHFKAAKKIIQYIKGTTTFGLHYYPSNHYEIVGYSESEWRGYLDDRKSTIAFVFFMRDTTFTWIQRSN